MKSKTGRAPQLIWDRNISYLENDIGRHFMAYKVTGHLNKVTRDVADLQTISKEAFQ